MDTIFMYLKKTLVLTVFLIFGFVATYIPQPHFIGNENIPKAEALIGGGIVFDPTNLVENAISAVLQGELVIKEYILDGIAWALAKSTISTMVGDMVNWVGNGFPVLDSIGNFGSQAAFVQNLERYMREVALVEADRYLEFLGSNDSFLCTPFELNIQTALAQEFADTQAPVGAPSGVYDRPYSSCNVEDEFEDFEAFISGDFSSGGWEDWFTVVNNPGKYTEYGQYLEAQQGRALAQAEAESNEAQLLGFGDGFKSVKQCETVSTPDGPRDNCSVVSPGTAIDEALNKALGAGQDSLVNADELSEVIVSLLSQIASDALTGSAGILGLVPGTGSTYSGYSGGSYTSQLQIDSQQQQQTSQNNNYSNQANLIAEISATKAIQDALAGNANSFITQLDASGTSGYFTQRSQAVTIRSTAQNYSNQLQAILDSGNYSSFNASSYYTQAQLETYTARWTVIINDIYNN